MLVESHSFPRPHIGESLPPSIIPLLEELGCAEQMESTGFGRYRSAHIFWGGNLELRPSPEKSPGFQVDRGQFDSILLDAARQAGVHVWQPAHALPAKQGIDGRWIVPIRAGGELHRIVSRHVVDASGRRGWLPLDRHRLSTQTVAMYAYWQGGAGDHDTRVEAGSDFWLWGAPLPGGVANIAIFLDLEQFRRKISHTSTNVKQCPKDSQVRIEKLYDEIIHSSNLFSQRFVSKQRGSVHCCDATPYVAQCSAGNGWICVGESGLAIDPLSSQGVQSAISSGLRGAAVVNTCLRRPADSQLSLDLHNSRLRDTFDLHQVWASDLYCKMAATVPNKFWIERSQLRDGPSSDQSIAEGLRPEAASESFRAHRIPWTSETRVVLSSECVFVEMPIIRNYLVERREAIVPSREITLPGGVKQKYVWAPAGAFTMGTPGATDNEAPVEVTLSSGFWLAQTETTQAQYTAIMGTTPWVEHGDTDYYKAGASFPASYINHTEAELFCAKLTEIERKAGRLPTGWKYALPTEAQWEYACRAGETTAYSFGDADTQLGDFAWFDKNALDIGEKYAHTVATK